MNSKTDHMTRSILVWAPLIAMPLMLNLRWSLMNTPNEEPKWFVLVLLGMILAVAGSWQIYRDCAAKSGREDSTAQSGLSLPGLLFVLFFAGLGVGVTYAINTQESINRFVFWCSGGLTFWATTWAVRHERRYLAVLQGALAGSAVILCAHFWYGFLVDFKNPDFNKFIQFSRIGHFNFTADVLMVLIPLLSWTFLNNRLLWVRLGAGFSLITTLFMLVTSGSLGGMGGLLAGGVVAGALGWMRRPSRRDSTKSRPLTRRWVLIAVTSGLLVFVAGKWVYEQMPKEYREQIFLRGEWWGAPKAEDFAKAQSLPPWAPLWIAITPYLGSRTPMWAATAGMVEERPWLGFGTGSFQTEYPGFSKRYDLFTDYETLGIKIKTNPHNILLQIAADNGLPMALLFAGLYLWLVARVMERAWQTPTVFWICSVWALWAAGLDAQVNHVFFNPASLFMAAVGFGLLYGELSRKSLPAIAPICGIWRLPVLPLLTSVFALLIASYPLRWVVSEYYVAEANRLSTTASGGTRREGLDWASAVAWSPGNASAIYGLALFNLQNGLTRQGEQMLTEFLALNPNHSVGLNFLAMLQAQSGRLDDAEATLEKALKLDPDASPVRENLNDLRKAKEQKASNPAL